AAPAGLAADAPLVIALHGRGADALDLSSLASEVGPGRYRWIFPQAPRPVPLGPGAVGWAWYEIGEDATVVAAREQLVDFLGAVLQELKTTASRAALIGFSQGGAMTLHGGLSFPEPFGAMGVMSGHLPAAHTLQPPPDRGALQPIVQVHGTEDQTLPIERGRDARDWLQKAGFASEYHEFRMGHQITGESLAVVAEFLSRKLV
ncbi:MAG TPA: alpha/beta hydrolase-fold protein, partial [Chloroflexota bacterium]